MDVVTLALAKQYTDSQRIAYVETGKREVFNATVTAESPEDPGMFALEGFIPVDGKEYEITMNGVTVKRTAFDPGRTHPDLGVPVGENIFLGNAGTFDSTFENTGDDWLISYQPAVFGATLLAWITDTPPESLAVRIVDMGEIVLLPEQGFLGSNMYAYGLEQYGRIPFEVGCSYRLYFDGAPWDFVVEPMSNDSFDECFAAGNIDFMSGAGDNGMPFAFFYGWWKEQGGFVIELYAIDAARSGNLHLLPESPTLKITRLVETIHPIDPKYIPGNLITDEEADALIASII